MSLPILIARCLQAATKSTKGPAHLLIAILSPGPGFLPDGTARFLYSRIAILGIQEAARDIRSSLRIMGATWFGCGSPMGIRRRAI
jgi:hypothetical protein